jgi:hypothetical protein
MASNGGVFTRSFTQQAVQRIEASFGNRSLPSTFAAALCELIENTASFF